MVTGTSNGEQLSISIWDFETTGSMTIGINAGGHASDSVNYHTALYGSVTITSISPSIAGTFHFVCTDSTKVTNGAFNTASQ